MLAALAVAVEAVAYLLQAVFPLILDTSLFHIAIIAYLAAIALDEIDLRDLLGRIAENRFQRVAMSLGDGLVCTNSNYLITVWNPGATAIFGYLPEEMIGRPFDTICARDEAGFHAFVLDQQTSHTSPAATLVEFDGRRGNGEVFPVEASFSRWHGADGVQFGAILRDISRAQARSRTHQISRGIRHADRVSPTAIRCMPDLAAMISTAEDRGAAR